MIKFKLSQWLLAIIHAYRSSNSKLSNENDYKNVIENTLVGIYIIQDNIFKYVNKRFGDILGYDPKEIINKKEFSVFVHPEDKDLVIQNVKKRIDNKVQSIEYEFRGITKKGNVKWVKVLGNLIDYNKRPAISGTIIDITESKNNAEQLKISEERLRVTLEATEIGVWDWDISSNKWFATPTFYTMQGFSPQEGYTNPKVWIERIHPEDREIVSKNIQDIIDNKIQHYEHEARMLHADGTYRWNITTGHAITRNENGDVIRMVGTRKNIHHMKETEQKLSQNKYILSKLIETIPDLVWLKDPDGKFLACNKRFEELLGKNKEGILGKTIYDFMPQERADFFKQFDILAASKRKPVCNEETLTFADGHTEVIETIKTPLFRQDKSLLGILGIGRDITERKHIEEERKQIHLDLEKRVSLRTSQLKQANSDLESFTYSVSHDLRAPIRHLNGFLSLLKETIDTDKTAAHKYITKLESASKRMSTLIDELLKFSRLGRAQLSLKEIHLNALIDTIIEQYKPDCEGRDIQWTIHQLPQIWADPALIKVVFENLISNAIKYTSNKEKSIIEIGQGSCTSDSTVCIYVKDNGAGFDMAFQNKLFGVFQRLHSNDEFSGIGIGLATVKQIISKHNGEISADSKVGEGATFFVRLPRS